MRFLRNHWFQIGLLVFIVLSYYMIFRGGATLSDLQKILMASLMALFLHQYEEYALPGGGPVVINRAFYGEDKLYRQYPGNWNSIMIVNVSAYVFYILAIVFSGAAFLGIATMLFNLFQVFGHAVEMNVKLKTWYNPGLATSVFLFLPISIYYFVFLYGNHLAGGRDLIYGVLMALLILVVTVVLPVQGLKRKDSPYLIPEIQIQAFEKVWKFASIHKEPKG